MQSVEGEVSMFLYDTEGRLQGFLLRLGQRVRFCVTLENTGTVREIVTTGSQVEVQGDLRTDRVGDEYMQATLIRNLDSKRTATFPAPNPAGKPGTLSDGAPNTEAFLAPSETESGRKMTVEKVNDSQTNAEKDDSDSSLAADNYPQHLYPGSYFHDSLQYNQAEGVARNEAARSIGRAYDSLHKIQAILAYMHIIQLRVPGISQFLSEAKRTYEQAMAGFACADFDKAKEFGEASRSLSRVVEIVTVRTLRSDTSLPSLVPRPPRHRAAGSDAERVEEHLVEAELVLSRIHWILENGTLPLEDRAQVRKIASWGNALYKQARQTYHDDVFEDAAELAHAALEGVHSAEYVCRKWYVSHSAHS
jgi:hypothetical protein